MPKYNYIVLLFISISFAALGQKRDRVKVSANKLKNGVYQGQKISRLFGNVRLKHQGKTMWCDSAYQFAGKDLFLGFGNVKIKETSNNYVTGDRFEYNGETKLAKVRENVYLTNGEMNLRTEILDHFTDKKTSYYYNGGVVKDGETTLSSISGVYFESQNLFHFKDSVQVINTTGDSIFTDTLVYNTLTKDAFLFGPTDILSEEQKLYAESGVYNTATEVANFAINTKVETPEYILLGDSLFYDRPKDFGHAFRNVILFSKEDSITIFGDEAYRDAEKQYAKVYGNPLMEKVDGLDTTYLKADTLISIEDSATGGANIIADNNVRLIQKDVQSLSDSLFYNFVDSIIYFYQDPILWSDANQVTADTIYVTMKNDQIDQMYANVNAFIISSDTLERFNQIKGRNLVGYFVDNELSKVTVNGNGESTYYAYNDEEEMVGLNTTICSNMNIFMEDNKVRTIYFLTKPDAHFIPPQNISGPETKLKGFEWRIDERPNEKTLRTEYTRLHNRPANFPF